MRDRRIVLKLVVVSRVGRMADARAAAVERSRHQDGRAHGVRDGRGIGPHVLEAQFVNGAAAQHRRLRDLHVLLGVLQVVGARHQVETADARVQQIGPQESVAQDQRVVRVDLVVHARAEADAPLRHSKDVRVRIDDPQRRRIERDPVDDGPVVHRVAPNVEEEGGALVKRPAHAPAVFFEDERRLLLRVRVAGIPETVAEVEVPGAVKFVSPRLGEDFDAAVAQLVEFRRERIRIDPDLANRLLRGELSAAESVDENRPAARPRRRTGQRLQVRLKIIRIVRQRVQIGAFDHQRAGVARRIGRDARPGTRLHGHLLRSGRNFELQV